MFVFDWEILIFLDVNDVFIKNYGYVREEIIGLNLEKIKFCEVIIMFEIMFLNGV